MTYAFRFAALAATVALSACSSGGGGGSSTPVSYGPSFQTLSNSSGTLARNIVGSDGVLNVTRPSALPTAGSATYNGFAAVGDPANPQAFGTMQLGVDFGSNRVGGSINNVADIEQRYSGSIALTNGVIRRNAGLNPAFNLDVNGTIVGEDSTRVRINGDADGVFANGGKSVAATGDVSVGANGTSVRRDINLYGAR
ncbi:hypothetical protein [Pelagovum pacificum]|uniref:Transferrin-binding protein-like solute binding protein n=1 Tax=Pelagovum pacificum TaxID=2588711 RepID=A0A5C5GDZ6_9RHOB|nr:hypothetical protein [Pelagovum pacificum]QQA41371.1 hypothetical protein I8N54_11070 [Pelagovum pacificum]TNY31826.1 hypothetical protein FHY64_00535 [Pelagovum pacificum]